MDIIFQSFTNVLYFLEFIRDNYADLGEIFEDDLKDLFGYNNYYTQDEFHSNPSNFQEGNHNNPGGPLQRLVDAIMMSNHARPFDIRDPRRPNYNKELDFLTVIISDIFIHTSLNELYQRFTEHDERTMMNQDAKRVRFWANFLAKQVKDRSKGAKRRVGYVPYKINLYDSDQQFQKK